jgi:hypothetical protein
LKGNQSKLRKDAEGLAAEQKADGFKDTTISQHETVYGDYSRIEMRTTTVIHDVAWLWERHEWPGLQSVVMAETEREIDKRIERETRFYISSLLLLANVLGPLVRDHWTVDKTSIGS